MTSILINSLKATGQQAVTRFFRLLLPVILFICASFGHAGTPPWADAPYSYYTHDNKLDTVLKDFASSFSLALNVGKGVEGTVNGRFNTKNPTEFINKLGSVYGFNWFTHAGTLFISRADDQRTGVIPAATNSTGQLREALNNLGILDTRFGWGELPEQGVAMVSGPPAYVELIERTVKSLPAAAGGQQVAVFRLKHASVDDRVISFRDKEIVTPGLATILRNLILGSSGGTRSGVNNEALASIAAPLRAAPPVFSETINGTPTTAANAGNNVTTTGRPATTTGTRVRTPSIQADVRLNSLIVQDIPERIPVYERLIRELDVPTALIEIQAMIVDVNSKRTEELGIDWGGRGNYGAVGFGNQSSEARAGTLTLNLTNTRGAVTPTALVVDSANFLVSRIRILEGIGDASIRSTPSVLTMDNQGALFDHSQTFYVRIQGERVATVTPITYGTTLRVTPRVVESDGQQLVQLVVDIEDGKIVEAAPVDTLPTVQRSGISTQALVIDNQTLVIGGYNNEQDVQQNDRIPILGQIPLLGVMFSNKTTDRQKRERLFLIKPKIVHLTGNPAKDTSVVPSENKAPEKNTDTPPVPTQAPRASQATPDAAPTAAPITSPTQAPAASPATTTDLTDSIKTATPLLDKLLVESHSWLQAVSNQRWFLQLYRTADNLNPDQVESVLNNIVDSGVSIKQLRVYHYQSASANRYGIIYGDYSSRIEAQNALSKIPEKLKRYRAYPRQTIKLKPDNNSVLLANS